MEIIGAVKFCIFILSEIVYKWTKCRNQLWKETGNRQSPDSSSYKNFVIGKIQVG